MLSVKLDYFMKEYMKLWAKLRFRTRGLYYFA